MKKEDLLNLGFYDTLGPNRQGILKYDIYIGDYKECYIELSERFKYTLPSLFVSEDNWDSMNANQTRLFMKDCNTIKKLKKQIEHLENLFGNLTELKIK